MKISPANIKIAAMLGAPDLMQDTLAVFQHDQFESGFSQLASMGYQGVEIMLKSPRMLNPEKISKLLADNSLSLVGLCTGHVFGEDGLGLVGPDPAVRNLAKNRLLEFIDLAGFFGEGTLVNIGRSRGSGFPGDSQKTLSMMSTIFMELAEFAAPKGVRLVLEPINSLQTNYIHTTQQGLELVKKVNHPNFGLMLDVFHMNIEDIDIFNSIREAKQHCWFVHLADNNRMHPGYAHIDFGQVIAALRDIDYCGFVSMEILPYPDPITAGKSAITHIQAILQNADLEDKCQ